MNEKRKLTRHESAMPEIVIYINVKVTWKQHDNTAAEVNRSEKLIR